MTSEQQQSSNEKEMSFLDHLEELRSRLIKSFLIIFLVGIICTIFVDELVHNVLFYHVKNLNLKIQVLSPYGIVLLYMEVIVISAIIISMPVILLQAWKFISPALLQKEKIYIRWITFFTSLCFFVGIAFGYFILIPTAMNFFANFGTDLIELNISADKYISFVLVMILSSGILFEIPMVAYFLTKMGILTPEFMRHYRRHAIVIILIISAIVTPTPDVITQSLLAIPMFILYELSIFISKYTLKKNS